MSTVASCVEERVGGAEAKAGVQRVGVGLGEDLWGGHTLGLSSIRPNTHPHQHTYRHQ